MTAKLISALQKFVLTFVTAYIESEQKAGKKYNDKPIQAVHSQMIGLTPAVNKALPVIAKEMSIKNVPDNLTGLEVYNEIVKPLVDTDKLFTVPAKKGYMLSLKPFNRTQKTTETGSEILKKLGIIS